MKLSTIMEIAFKKKKVVRKGKVIKKKVCGKGYKYDSSANRCIRMGASERRQKKMQGKKSARQSKSARTRNRKRSFRLRKRRNL